MIGQQLCSLVVAWVMQKQLCSLVAEILVCCWWFAFKLRLNHTMLCFLRSKMFYGDHFIQHLSVRLSVVILCKNFLCNLKDIHLISPLSVKRGGGDLRFPWRLSVSLSVCPSVPASVCLSVNSVSVHSVFRTFLSRLLRYWLEIWYMTLSWLDTDHVWLLSRLTFLYSSYCPLQKISFPDFSLSSFDILTWNSVYGFVLTWYSSSSTFVAFDLLLLELLPFAKILLSWFFSLVFCDLDLKFSIWICLDIIQINFDFCYVWLTFTWVINSPLLKFHFPDFSSSSFKILTCSFMYEFVPT